MTHSWSQHITRFNTTIQSYSFLTKELLYISIMLTSGMIWFHIAEWWSYFDSLYFTVITMTWVWFWDITPTTTITKIMSMIYAVLWVPMFIYTTSIFLQIRFKNYLSRMKKQYTTSNDGPQHPIEVFLQYILNSSWDSPKKHNEQI